MMGKLRNFVLLFLLSFLTACGEKEVEKLSVYQTMDDLKGKKVGTLTGCFQEALLEKEYPDRILGIDASRTIDEIKADIYKKLEEVLESVSK